VPQVVTCKALSLACWRITGEASSIGVPLRFLSTKKIKGTMAKIDNRPKEKTQLTIEFADNGIILRNPDCEDEVTLALTGKGTHNPGGYGYDIDHSEEYRAIGKKIYDWLIEVAVVEHSDYFITTGAELDITATLNGRRM
jgi:hypothetical protein